MKSILKRVGEFFQNVEKKKLILIIALASVILLAAVIGAILLNRDNYAVLYSGLDASEAGTIKTLLDDKGVKSQVQGTSTILVPEDQADTLRIELASEGYPSTGLNYNIFQGSASLGSTDLERRTYLQYQLQENIRQTLRHMEKVEDCIVIVNLASESSFVITDNMSEASIAVQLSIKNGQTLTSAEAGTIHKLVLKCVPDLKPENVSIVDSKMNYYDVASDDENALSMEYTATQQQLTEQMKDILTEQVMRVLEPFVGAGNAAVSVNLTMNFDKETVSMVEFSPPIAGEDDGLIRSMQELYNTSGATAGAGGAAGTDTNGSGNPAYVAAEEVEPGTDTSYDRTYNFELNEIQTQIQKAQGVPENLSVAVLLNNGESGAEGIEGYVDGVKDLVAKSIGVKPDYISVELMPFVTDDSMENAFLENQKNIQSLNRTKLITTIITIVGLMAIVLLIGRFFFRKPERPDEEEEEPELAGQLVGVTAGDMGDMMDASPLDAFDMADLVLKKSSEAEKIEELMDRYPETVAQILRSWLSED